MRESTVSQTGNAALWIFGAEFVITPLILLLSAALAGYNAFRAFSYINAWVGIGFGAVGVYLWLKYHSYGAEGGRTVGTMLVGFGILSMVLTILLWETAEQAGMIIQWAQKYSLNIRFSASSGIFFIIMGGEQVLHYLYLGMWAFLGRKMENEDVLRFKKWKHIGPASLISFSGGLILLGISALLAIL